jgi:hypothetical protein
VTTVAFLVVGVVGLVALAVTVIGFLWLLQFVLNNEERKVRRP